MAYEQLRGEKSNDKNDIYGLGVVLLECMTRKRIQDIAPRDQDDKRDLSQKLRLIPQQFEKSLTNLLKSCLIRHSQRATSFQVIRLQFQTNVLFTA